MENRKESEIPWMEENFPNSLSTSIPDIIVEESNEIGTVVIFVISALLIITILFVGAIFIDCRQEKLHKLNQKLRPRKVPRFGAAGRAHRYEEDKSAIIDQMQEGPSSSNVIV